MGARQGARGHLRLQQRADRRQFLDPLGRQFRRRDPARGGQRQRPLGHQPPHRLARRGHRHAEGLGQGPAASAPGPAPVRHASPARASDRYSRSCAASVGIRRGAGVVEHGAQRNTRGRGVNPRVRKRSRAGLPVRAQPGPLRRLARHQPRHHRPEGRANGSSRPDAPPHAPRHSPAPRRCHDQPPGIHQPAVRAYRTPSATACRAASAAQ